MSAPFLIGMRRREKDWTDEQFPFSVPTLAGLEELELGAAVTVLVGENGSGKSTLIEGIAAGIQKIAVGSEDLGQDESMAAARRLGDQLRFVWRKKTARGFFLRAEDFFGYAKRLQGMRHELSAMEEEFDRTLEGYGKQLAMGTVRGQRAAIENKYGGDLDHYSHGEAFLRLFQERLVPGGLYLLDEPETPLSPMRQLALLTMMKEAVDAGSQFIMATHSPILMAYPGAEILKFESGKILEANYDELEHVTLTRAFLNHPERYLRHL